MSFLQKFVFAVFLLFINAFSQQPNLRFNHLTVDDGLSQTTANAIHQDEHGFIWFGTQDGLNRYDGYNFKIYSHQSGNLNSLNNNYLWTIHEDIEGVMWIGSFGGGLTKFDPAAETYEHFKNNENDTNSLSSNYVFRVLEYPAGTLWLRTGNGINKFEKKTNIITRYFSKKILPDERRESYMSALEIQPPNLVWAGCDSGLVKININTNTVDFYKSDPIKGELIFGSIYKLVIEESSLFVCCDSGLIQIDFSAGRSYKLPIPLSIDNENISFRHLLIDGDNYWIGTTNGLILYDKNKRTYQRYSTVPNDPYSLLHNNIVSLMKSKEGLIWIGTYGGINILNKIKPDFSLVQYDPNKKNTLSQKSVGATLEDKNGIVWIGTPDGLNAYNRTTNKNIIFKNIPGKPGSLSSNYILSIYEDKKGNIWIGTRNGGINKISYKNVSNLNNIFFERIKSDDTIFTSQRIQSIYEDNEGTMWFGTGGRGLIKYNHNTGESRSYPQMDDGSGLSHSFVYSMLEDNEGNFWIGTPTGGLNILDRKNDRFLYIKNKIDDKKSLSNDIILSIFQDSKNKLWIGTSGGLNRLDTPIEKNMFEKIKDSSITLSFTQYGKKQGLPNEVIYGILEDDYGFLWFSTNKGLVKFDPSSARPVIKAFDVNDGLQNNEFNQSSFFKNKSGEMYFGGIGGLNIFHPAAIKLNDYKPPVVFTDFKLFNESVPVNGNDNFSLLKSITNTGKINLSYDHSVISFEFAALNYINTKKNQYAYIMEGFDKDWIYGGAQRNITYTNLDPGNYVFRVKASNNDGVWNEQDASIKIIILPPPWLRWYAYIFYSMIFAASVFLFIRYRVKTAKREFETNTKIERAKLEEREEVRKKSSADFHDEAGNKLTKISLFTELARGEAEDNSSLKKYLNKIEETTKELSSGMRDFIWVLDPKQDSIYETILRLQDFGNSIFNYSNINFSVNGLITDLKKHILSMESRRAVILIFKEAMNNCIKYSCAKHVELSIQLLNEKLLISLCDDGIGFSGSNPNGYGLNNMQERAAKINCALAIDSEPGKGTKISLSGNITHMSN